MAGQELVHNGEPEEIVDGELVDEQEVRFVRESSEVVGRFRRITVVEHEFTLGPSSDTPRPPAEASNGDNFLEIES